MSVGTTNIALYNTVAAELLLTGTPMKISDLYATANLSKVVSAGSFHNINIGPAAANNFATMIWTYYNSGQDQGLENWMYYYHDERVNLSWSVTDTSGANDIYYEVYLSDTRGAYQYMVYSANVLAGNTDSQSDYQTWVNAYSAFFPSGGYYIEIILFTNPVAPPPPVLWINFNASDLDGVGSGTDRKTYTDIFGPNFYDMYANGNMFMDTVVAENYAGPWITIAWNKRTYFDIMLQP